MSEKFIKLTNFSQRPLAVNPRHVAMVLPATGDLKINNPHTI